MPSTLATADAVLKEDYKDEIRDQINQKTFITTQIEKNTEDVTGRRALLALHTRRSTGVGARKEYGTLPTAGNQGYQDIFIPVRYNYGRIELSGPVIKAMDKDRGSFTRAVKSETDGIKRDTARDVNRQIWGTADGVIAQCGTTTAANAVVLAATTTRTQMRQLWNEGGMLVDIGTVAAPTTIASARAVTAFTNPPSPTITISGAVLSPSTEPSWASYVDSNSGTLRIASEGLINKAMMETELAGGSQVDLLVSSAGVSRAIASSMQALRRNVDNVQLKAGYSGIAWTSPTEGMGQAKAKALCWDRDCPENNLFGLSTDHLKEFILNDWDWMDQDGAVLSRVSGKDAYEGTMFKYHETATDQRSAHMRVADLIEG
jgi:hypothetical protein